jgi:hypothetical protein
VGNTLADFRILPDKPPRNAQIRRTIRSHNERKNSGIWKKPLQKNRRTRKKAPRQKNPGHLHPNRRPAYTVIQRRIDSPHETIRFPLQTRILNPNRRNPQTSSHNVHRSQKQNMERLHTIRRLRRRHNITTKISMQRLRLQTNNRKTRTRRRNNKRQNQSLRSPTKRKNRQRNVQSQNSLRPNRKHPAPTRQNRHIRPLQSLLQ